MVDMVRKQILPAVGRYEQSLVETALGKRQLNSGLPCARETKTVGVLSGAADAMELDASELEKLLENAHEISDVTEQAKLLKEKVLPQMEKLRADADLAERFTAEEYWPFPSYTKLLYSE